jgi:alcohol dehydrogenase
MVAGYLARACADGADLEARSQLLLASHMAGIGMATTGLGLAHAIGHALGGRYDIAHGITLAMVLPPVLAFSAPMRSERLAALAFAFGAGDHGRDNDWNATACVDAVAALRSEIGLALTPAAFGVGEADYPAIARAALDDQVLVNTPRQPAAADIEAMLAAADDCARIV